MSISKLKQEMLEMIKLSGEISKYSEMILHEKEPKKVGLIRDKIKDLEIRFFELRDKWFSD